MFKKNRFLFILLIVTINMTFVIRLLGSFRFNMAVSDLVLPFALFSLLFKIRKEKNQEIFKYCFVFLILIFWIIVSGLNSIHSNEISSSGLKSIFSESIKTIICIMYFWAGYNTLKTISQEDLKKSWFASIVIFVFFGIAVSIFYNTIYPIFDQKYNGYYYFTGTDSDSNHAATFLFLSFFAFGFFDHIEKSKSSRKLFIIVSAISIFGIILTTSRSGLIALIFGCMIMFVIQKKTAKSILILFLIFMVIVLTTIAVDSFIFKGLFFENIYYKIKSIEDGLNVRSGLGLSALKMGNNNPIFGVGRGNFILNSKAYFSQLNQTYVNDIPHNTIFGLYAELGILGVCLFSFPVLAMLYCIFKYIKFNRKSDFNISNLAWLIAGISSVLVQSTVLNIENRRFLWFITGLVIYVFEENIINFNNSIPKIDSFFQKEFKPQYVFISLIIVILLGYNLKDISVSIRNEHYNDSHTYKFPYQTTSESEDLEVVYILNLNSNPKKTPQLKVDIVESLGSKEIILDSYTYISVNGQIKRKIKTTMENSSIRIKFTKLKESTLGYSFKPVGLANGRYFININKHFLLRSVVYETKYFEKNKQEIINDVNYDYKKRVGSKFGDLIEFRGIEFSEAQNSVLLIKFKAIKEINFNYQFICFAYPDNIHSIDEHYFERGYVILNPIENVYTSEWKMNSEYIIAVEFPEEGIYNLEFGFILPFENNISHLMINKNDKFLDIGRISIEKY